MTTSERPEATEPPATNRIRPRRVPFVSLGVMAVAILAIYGFTTRRVVSEIAWLDDFGTAVKRAQSRQVPILLDFWADWCGPCLALDATLFSSEPVGSAVSEHVVPMRVDLSERPPPPPGADLARHYAVNSLPTLLIIDPDSGEVIARAGPADETSPDAFISFLRRTP